MPGIEGRKRLLRRGLAIAGCLWLGIAICLSARGLRRTPLGAATAQEEPLPQSGEPIAVQSGVMGGYRISGPLPQYPRAAKKKIEGTVVLDGVIGRHGNIIRLTVRSGPMELRKSALDAVAQWRYRPYLLDGVPVAVKTTISVVFSLGK